MDRPASLSSIPPELLGEIFYHCSALCSDAPLVLSQVSPTFHQAVHTTPRIWQKLHLRVVGGNDVRSVRKSKLWLSMVGTCMVDVQAEIIKPNVDPFGGLFLKGASPPSFAVAEVLRQHPGQIRSLALQAPSEVEARIFLTSIYGDETLSLAHGRAALHSLTLQISSSSFPTLSRISPLSSPTLPNLPSLQSLTLVNHSISCLVPYRFEALRYLSITCPVRFQPLKLSIILGVLRSSSLLETLAIEARVTDAPVATTSSHPEIPDDSHSTLIHLPYLTRLSLRTNTIPSLLNQLLLPNLHTLHLDDLNGKRSNCSEETGAMIRQLLVRMELPNEYRSGTGLKVLELVGIDISPHPDGQDGVWEWCLRRMTSLQDLSINKADPSHILYILTPALTSRSHPIMNGITDPLVSIDTTDDLVCPRLERLSIIESGSRFILDRFQRQRPRVTVNFDVVMDPLSPLISSTPVDFLSLYANKPQFISPPVTPKAESSLSTRRTPNSSFGFGPWLVLAQRPDGDDHGGSRHQGRTVE